MASDTGAPWNLPYPEDSDFVRDGALDIEALAVAVASGLTAANVGIGTNTVYTPLFTGFSTTSTSLVNITGAAVTITPSTITSKILVIQNVARTRNSNAGQANQFAILRNATLISDSVFFSFATAGASTEVTVVVLDSPGTISPVTYQAQVAVTGGTANVDRITMTAIEVAA
jgi:hypothetical protein